LMAFMPAFAHLDSCGRYLSIGSRSATPFSSLTKPLIVSRILLFVFVIVAFAVACILSNELLHPGTLAQSTFCLKKI
jgi:hypothetical protein